MADKKDKSVLSKNLMQMKFMQRSVLRIEEEKNAEEKQRDIDAEHWVLDVPQGKHEDTKFGFEPSFMVCEDLIYGRFSAKQCNPEIEKIMSADVAEKEEEKQEVQVQQEVQKQTQDLNKRYSTLIGIISKKFQKKRQRNLASSKDGRESSSRPKFRKPEDS